MILPPCLSALTVALHPGAPERCYASHIFQSRMDHLGNRSRSRCLQPLPCFHNISFNKLDSVQPGAHQSTSPVGEWSLPSTCPAHRTLSVTGRVHEGRRLFFLLSFATLCHPPTLSDLRSTPHIIFPATSTSRGTDVTVPNTSVHFYSTGHQLHQLYAWTHEHTRQTKKKGRRRILKIQT